MNKLKSIGVFTLALYISILSAHANNCPKPVLAAFKKAFPTAKKVKWSTEKAKDKSVLHEAEFKNDKQEMSATYTEQGTLVETEMDITKADVPAAVMAAVAKSYPKAVIKEYAKITRASGAVVYEIEVKDGGKSKDLLFNPEGMPTE